MKSKETLSMKPSRGFTLIELMLVVIIIGIIAAIAVPRMTGRTERARTAAAKQGIAALTTALDGFELSVGRFPSTEEGLNVLIERPAGLTDEDGWDGPYMREIPFDPWNRPYEYRYPGQESIDFDLISVGRDGQKGTDDDVTNFTRREER